MEALPKINVIINFKIVRGPIAFKLLTFAFFFFSISVVPRSQPLETLWRDTLRDAVSLYLRGKMKMIKKAMAANIFFSSP
jgi:hypothetical protein